MKREYKDYKSGRPCCRCGETDDGKFGYILGKYRKNACRKCEYLYKKEHRQRNPEKYREYQRDYYKRNREAVLAMHKRFVYKMTKDEMIEMINKFGGVCPVCGREKSLVIDHDHKSGKVRGMVCVNCNILLGHCRDDVTVLEKMINYLKGI